MENRDLHPGFLNPSYPVVMCSLETHVKTGTQWRETDWSGKAAVAAPRTYELAMTWKFKGNVKTKKRRVRWYFLTQCFNFKSKNLYKSLI